MIIALAHVCLFSQDLERTEAFYCGLLGLRRHFDFHKHGGLFGFYLQIADGQFLEVFASAAAGEVGRQRMQHLCLEVADIDALRRVLERGGVAVTPKKLGCDQSWQCWCKDPDGVDIEFQQYTAASSQFTKTPCQVNW